MTDCWVRNVTLMWRRGILGRNLQFTLKVGKMKMSFKSEFIWIFTFANIKKEEEGMKMDILMGEDEFLNGLIHIHAGWKLHALSTSDFEWLSKCSRQMPSYEVKSPNPCFQIRCKKDEFLWVIFSFSFWKINAWHRFTRWHFHLCASNKSVAHWISAVLMMSSVVSEA